MVPPTCSWGMPPPCTSHCRLSADGLLASSSFFPNKYQPFFHKNPVVSLGILSGSLLGSLLLILPFGSPSPHLLVPLPAHIQAAQGLPLPSNILLHVPFCPFTCFHVSLGMLPSRRAFCCCGRCAAPGTSAFAIAWLGLALAILRALPAFFASPSQEILSGH